ncbi:hypothetical protein [Neopusillimonas maritima]|nr:hypothetical protein [Neopusillimonas maritima]
MAIKDLRRMGKKPTQVFVVLLEDDSKLSKYVDPEDMLINGFLPEVLVEPGDDIHRLDFRFLVGVIVHLQGQNVDRLRSAFGQIRLCKPARIVVSGPSIFYDTLEKA